MCVLQIAFCKLFAKSVWHLRLMVHLQSTFRNANLQIFYANPFAKSV